MVHVVLASDFAVHTGGVTRLEVEADTLGRLIGALELRFPGFTQAVAPRMAAAIDGEIHHDDLATPIGAASEVFLLPRIGGG